jgi:hypothetical protein
VIKEWTFKVLRSWIIISFAKGMMESDSNDQRMIPSKGDRAEASNQSSNSIPESQFAQMPKFIIPKVRARPPAQEELSRAAIVDAPKANAARFISHISLDDDIVDSTPPERPAWDDDDSVKHETKEEDQEIAESLSAKSPVYKRRRLDQNDFVGVQDRTFVISPAASTAPNSTTKRVWRFPRPDSRDGTEDTTTRITKDSFITPVVEAHKDPLPAFISPHKKSQRFLPNGLAAAMRSNIMSIASKGQSKAGESQSFKVKSINSSQAPEMSTVEAVTLDGDDVRFILAGPGQRPQPGEIFSIPGIHWPAEILNQEYIVVVEWRVGR